MARTNFFRAVALTLALSTGFMGCVAPSGRPTIQDTRLATCSGDTTHQGGLVTADESDDPVTSPIGQTGGLVQTHGGGHAGALVLFGVIVGFVVLADLLILPFTAPCHHSFCCTRTVYVSCCR